VRAYPLGAIRVGQEPHFKPVFFLKYWHSRFKSGAVFYILRATAKVFTGRG
jgi:hypothetical protein